MNFINSIEEIRICCVVAGARPEKGSLFTMTHCVKGSDVESEIFSQLVVRERRDR